jgi:hypothetical protein
MKERHRVWRRCFESKLASRAGVTLLMALQMLSTGKRRATGFTTEFFSSPRCPARHLVYAEQTLWLSGTCCQDGGLNARKVGKIFP